MKITVGQKVAEKSVVGVSKLTPGVWRNTKNNCLVFVGNRVSHDTHTGYYTGIVVYENDQWMSLSNDAWEQHTFVPVREILTLTPTE